MIHRRHHAPGDSEGGNSNEKEADAEISQNDPLHVAFYKEAGRPRGMLSKGLANLGIETGSWTIALTPGLPLIPNQKINGQEHTDQTQQGEMDVDQA